MHAGGFCWALNKANTARSAVPRTALRALFVLQTGAHSDLFGLTLTSASSIRTCAGQEPTKLLHVGGLGKVVVEAGFG